MNSILLQYICFRYICDRCDERDYWLLVRERERERDIMQRMLSSSGLSPPKLDRQASGHIICR
jgi:hypothetical protein